MNRKATYQNLWDTEKAVLRVKCIERRAYIKNSEISNNLTMNLKLLVKQKQAKIKSSWWKDIITIREEVSKMKT
jgi:hypothetical protein